MTATSFVPQNLSDDIAVDAPAEAAAPQQVAVLALEPVIGFDTTIPPTVLGSAETAEGAPLYEVRVCGLTTAPVMSTMGYALVPQAGP
ncbi:hypothetical protein ACW9HQ_46200, partial [Nocardia gipuzkoensis]